MYHKTPNAEWRSRMLHSMNKFRNKFSNKFSNKFCLYYIVTALHLCSFLYADPKTTFYALKHEDLSPVRPVSEYKLLTNGQKSFELKKELLGFSSDGFFLIDPRLSTIDLFSFEYRPGKVANAFTQSLIAYADAGKEVNVALTDTLQRVKELELLGNRVDYFQGSLLYTLYTITATNNAKVFLTQKGADQTDPLAKQGTLIVGSRNIADCYHIEECETNVSSSTCYQDIELLLESPSLASDAHQLLGMLKMRFGMYLPIPSFIPETSNEELASHSTLARFFMSYPFAERPSFMKVMIPLINSAERSIVLFSPYHSPSKAFTKAIEAAIEKGVEVTIISNLTQDVKNNPLWDKIYQSSLNKYKELNANVLMWSSPSFFNAKVATFDDEVTYIGSGNFNLRSAQTDIESGCLILSKELNEEIKAICNTFKLSPYELQPISIFERIQIDVLKAYF